MILIATQSSTRKLATQHIDQQIHVLRGAMSRSFASGEPHSSSTSTYGSTPESGHHAGSLAALLALAQRIKRDVVETVRRVVEIMGKYAGKALPVEARSAVRGFILSLPSRLV